MTSSGSVHRNYIRTINTSDSDPEGASQNASRALRVLMVTQDLESNSTGRTWVLWNLARELGWHVHVASLKGERIWEPVRGTEFEKDCSLYSSTHEGCAAIVERADNSDLVIAAKPLPETLGVARKVAHASKKPLLLDVDDPDLEIRLGLGRWWEPLARAVLRPSTFWPSLAIGMRMAGIPVIVSNPTLQRRYGGTLIPHARIDSGDGKPHVSNMPRVVFVGTNRRHKGVNELRHAVDKLHTQGFTLTVTDRRPSDAKPWERWVGTTSMKDGIQLVKESDIVVLSARSNSVIPRYQLPAKLMDAMLAGRAVIISDHAPLLWALGSSGRVADPDAVELARVLKELQDPKLRSRLGRSARARALSSFTVTACAPAFESACRRAISEFEPGRSPRQQASRESFRERVFALLRGKM